MNEGEVSGSKGCTVFEYPVIKWSQCCHRPLFQTPITRVIPEASPVWSSHCQLLREFRIKLRVKFCMIMSAQPTHVAKIKIQLFQHLVRVTYIWVAWHFWPALTWPESLTFQSVTKSNQWIFKKAAMNEIAQLYIFSCFLIIQQRYWYRPPSPGHPAGPKTGTNTWCRPDGNSRTR